MRITDFFDSESQRARWLDKLKVWGWPTGRAYEEDGSFRVERDEPEAKVKAAMKPENLKVDRVWSDPQAPKGVHMDNGESEATGPGEVLTRFTDPKARDRFTVQQQLQGWRVISTSEEKADGAAQRRGVGMYFDVTLKQTRKV